MKWFTIHGRIFAAVIPGPQHSGAAVLAYSFCLIARTVSFESAFTRQVTTAMKGSS